MVGETRDGAEADGVVRAWERAVSHNARRRWWPWFLVMARGGEGERGILAFLNSTLSRFTWGRSQLGAHPVRCTSLLSWQTDPFDALQVA